MILTVLPALPPLASPPLAPAPAPIWPSIAADGGTIRSEDDKLSHKPGEINKMLANTRQYGQDGALGTFVFHDTEFEQLNQVLVIFCVLAILC